MYGKTSFLPISLTSPLSLILSLQLTDKKPAEGKELYLNSIWVPSVLFWRKYGKWKDVRCCVNPLSSTFPLPFPGKIVKTSSSKEFFKTHIYSCEIPYLNCFCHKCTCFFFKIDNFFFNYHERFFFSLFFFKWIHCDLIFSFFNLEGSMLVFWWILKGRITVPWSVFPAPWTWKCPLVSIELYPRRSLSAVGLSFC